MDGKVDVVVTQHKALLELLKERGLADETTTVISHVDVKDLSPIRGKNTAGILPFHLAMVTRSHTEIPIAITAEERASKAEMTLERLREIAGPARTYEVTPIARIPWR
jgi:hypothetical protein